jgi:small-conductance mechanosensitive channel
MRWSLAAFRFAGVALLGCLTVLLWFSYEFAVTHGMFGVSALVIGLHVAAAIAAASFAILVGGLVFTRVALPRVLNTEPTDLQRRLVTAILTFAATAAVLAHFGFDFSSILVFSALITAVIGLSIQPMIGSLISGLAIDRVVRPGDGVVVNGETIEVSQLHWRSVAGRRTDGARIVLPNARLADNTMEILQQGRPIRVEVRFDAPIAIAPHRLQSLAADTVADLPGADLSQPVVLMPLNLDRTLPFQVLTPGDNDHLFGRYRLTFWIRDFNQRVSSEGRVLRWLWYALRRENLATPARDSVPELERTVAATLRENSIIGVSAKEVVETSELLMFDDGESIRLTRRLAGHHCLILDGAVTELADARARHVDRRAALRRLKQMLANRIGPFADHIVDRAAANDVSLAAVSEAVALEIDEPWERAKFLAEANYPEEVVHDPGFLFRLAGDWREAGGHLFRAVEYAAVLAIPGHLLARAKTAPLADH